ncbi:MAG TPA: hypothetical protein VIA10_10045 [Gaiellaceae bacterium]
MSDPVGFGGLGFGFGAFLNTHTCVFLLPPRVFVLSGSGGRPVVTRPPPEEGGVAGAEGGGTLATDAVGGAAAGCSVGCGAGCGVGCGAGCGVGCGLGWGFGVGFGFAGALDGFGAAGRGAAGRAGVTTLGAGRGFETRTGTPVGLG